MIKAHHTMSGRIFFTHYSRIALNRAFRRIRINGEFNDRDLPVLLIGNHFSWWDGFIQYYLNNRIFHRKFHILMLEEQLRKYPILTKGGAFSINKGKRGILESLSYCSELLKNPENILVFFPQGEIQSIYTKDFQFERGIEVLLKRTGNPVHLVFNVNLIDYFSYRKPELTIYYKEGNNLNDDELCTIQKAYNDFVLECMKKQKEA
jgi:1-acyl-sn-glycerol-3-phosphate acyltransferase